MNYLLCNPLANAGKGLVNSEEAMPELKEKFGELTVINLVEYNKEEF